MVHGSSFIPFRVCPVWSSRVRRFISVVFQVRKVHQFGVEMHRDYSRRAAAVLSADDFGRAGYPSGRLIIRCDVAVDEQYHVGVLLDGA